MPHGKYSFRFDMIHSTHRAAFDGKYEGRRVLVTGATGFKGSWLCQWLASLGAKVAGLSIDLPSDPCHFNTIGLKDVIADHRLDIGNLPHVRSVFDSFQPEVVFHLAAQALVRRSYDDPVNTFTTNVLGTVNLLEAVRHCPTVEAVVMITSDKCYENIEQAAGYIEKDRVGGKDPYSASKGCAELVISSYTRSFFKAPNRWLGQSEVATTTRPLIAIGRAGNVIGGGDWAADRIIPDCVRAWYSDERPIIRSPHATRPWQHVLEPLSGYLWLGARLLQGERQHHGDAYNFGPQPDVDETVLRLIEAIRSHWPEAPKPDVRPPPNMLPEAGLLRLNCSKAAEHLNWSATLDFNQTAQFTALWYRAYQDSPDQIAQITEEQIRNYTSIASNQNASWATSKAPHHN